MIKILKLTELSDSDRELILRRAHSDIEEVKDKVAEIISDVRERGDDALVEYTKQWDDPDFTVDRLKVTEEEFDEAYKNTEQETVARIQEQIALSNKFFTQQREQIRNWEYETETGITAGEKWTPIEEVGLYVPGGKNPFPTVQQILAVPARIAKCKRIASTISPRGKNYEVLIAAREAGAEELYRVSGAQAVAALAYGTETIKPVDLVAGPGSPFVTAAKILCQGQIAIDMPAGPSEAIILADDSTTKEISLEVKARYCAADILARAEHGADSAGVLVTDSKELAELTKEEVARQTPLRSRREKHIVPALEKYCAIIVTDSIEEAIDFTNEYAPEHLELLTQYPRATLEKIENAGSVFLGLYNPVAVGDYASGVGHILPTGQWARRVSAVGVWTFMKRVQYSEVTKGGLERLLPIIERISDVEGLDAHKESCAIRLKS